MSDQDFFFDEEEETAKEVAKTSAKSSGKSSSKPTTKSASKPSAAPHKATSASAKGTPATANKSAAGIFEQNVSVTIAALMTVIGLLVGVIIGFVVAPDGSSTTGTPAASSTGTNGGATAPALSQDQLNSGQLPAGHPSIGATQTPTTTP